MSQTDITSAPWLVPLGSEIWALQLPDGRVDLTTVNTFYASVAVAAGDTHQVVRLRVEAVDLDAPAKKRWFGRKV